MPRAGDLGLTGHKWDVCIKFLLLAIKDFCERGSRRSVRSRGNRRSQGLYELTVSEAAFIGPVLFSNGWCPRAGRRSVCMAPPLVQKLYLIDTACKWRKCFLQVSLIGESKGRPQALQQKTNSMAPMDFFCLIPCVKALLFGLTSF